MALNYRKLYQLYRPTVYSPLQAGQKPSLPPPLLGRPFILDVLREFPLLLEADGEDIHFFLDVLTSIIWWRCSSGQFSRISSFRSKPSGSRIYCCII